MMKMVMISYNEAVDMEVMEVLEHCSLKNYTKVLGVYGRGEASGAHLGNDIWPGRNNLIYVVCKEEEAKKVLSSVKALRKTLSKEGVKAFTLPIEDLT